MLQLLFAKGITSDLVGVTVYLLMGARHDTRSIILLQNDMDAADKCYCNVKKAVCNIASTIMAAFGVLSLWEAPRQRVEKMRGKKTIGAEKKGFARSRQRIHQKKG